MGNARTAERLSSFDAPHRATVRLAVVGLHDAARDPLLGTVIGGRYRIERELGRGGMGVVYVATHLALDRPVAIKVLPASLARAADVLRRFEREARAACRIEHPHVVDVFDLGRLTTGEPYLAMELLVGHDLEHAMATRGRLPIEDMLALLVPLASALDTLHAEGFVHRDIKPSNVFLARTPHGHVVKLVDFGLATLARPSADAQRLTRVGEVVGTPHYLPPESARGELCDARGDVYSLAVMAFEMLAGATPFDGEPMSVMLEKLTRPASTLGEIAGLPFSPAVEQVMARALDRDPARRPASAGAFVAALTEALHTSPLCAVTEQRAAVRTAKPRTRRGVLAALAIALVLAAIVLSFTTPSPATTTAARPRAVVSTAAMSSPAHVSAPPPAAEPVVAIEATPSIERPAPPRRAARPRRAVPVVAIVVPSAPSDAAPGSLAHADQLVHDAAGAMVRGEIARAHALYAEATTAAPRNAAAWRGLGLACERQHLAPEARRAYARYLELAPSAPDAPTVRARLDRLP